MRKKKNEEKKRKSKTKFKSVEDIGGLAMEGKEEKARKGKKSEREE